MIQSQRISRALEAAYPEASEHELREMRRIVKHLLESKNVGSFKGDVSVFKQDAIGVASAMPAPSASRNALEKDAAKKLDKVVARLEKEMLSTLKKFRADKISKTKFKETMKSRLTIAYQDAYALGTRASGLVRATDLSFHTGSDEKRWIQSAISQEQTYFNKFLADLLKGQSLPIAKRRISNYANAVRSIFDSSKVVQLPDNVIIHWVLQSGNPCPECRLLHRLSPFTKATLPTTPKAGSTRCLSYCYCKLRIVQGTPAKVKSIARRNRSADYLLKKLKASRKKSAKK